MASVTNSPYSYLSTIQAATVANPTTATQSTQATDTTNTTTATNPVTATNSTSTADATASSLVSSLLGGSSTSGFSSEILSLLQQNSSGSFDPITSLLGGTSTNDAITSLLTNVYNTNSNAALTIAKNNNTSAQAAQTATQASPVQNLITASVKASQAYNATIQQNAANIISNNSYGADGVTSLVA